MTPEELDKAIHETKQEIYEVREQLEQTTNPREERMLIARLKELQYLQLWHIDQLQISIN